MPRKLAHPTTPSSCAALVALVDKPLGTNLGTSSHSICAVSPADGLSCKVRHRRVMPWAVDNACTSRSAIGTPWTYCHGQTRFSEYERPAVRCLIDTCHIKSDKMRPDATPVFTRRCRVARRARLEMPAEASRGAKQTQLRSLPRLFDAWPVVSPRRGLALLHEGIGHACPYLPITLVAPYRTCCEVLRGMRQVLPPYPRPLEIATLGVDGCRGEAS